MQPTNLPPEQSQWRQQALQLMQEYFAPDRRQVQHALQVTQFAERICSGEGVRQPFINRVVTLAGIFHDVGIPEALRLRGTAAGPHQEELGEPIARRLLQSLSTRPDVLERVCYIVRHHHSQEFIDGMDFQALFEADALVNLPNRHRAGRLSQPLRPIIDRIFVTATGRSLIEQWGREEGLL
ncbi:MAG: HD domain-containing protein [Bacillota bacterium]